MKPIRQSFFCYSTHLLNEQGRYPGISACMSPRPSNQPVPWGAQSVVDHDLRWLFPYLPVSGWIIIDLFPRNSWADILKSADKRLWHLITLESPNLAKDDIKSTLLDPRVLRLDRR
jgi:hypothetical protein